MSKRVAILISGSGSNMVSLVRAMQENDIGGTPVLVLSNNADAFGLDKAKALGVCTAVLDHKPFGKDRAAFETALTDILRVHKIDVICLAGFMRVLTTHFVEAWADRVLNIHPSLLPKYKGLNTHQRAIDAGDSVAGVSVHLVTSELDGGPILGQTCVTIAPGETAETLATKVLAEEHKLYPRVLAEFLAD